MEPADFQAWLGGGNAGRHAGRGGREAVPRISRASPATATTRRRAAPQLKGLFGNTVQLQGGATVVADEAYIRESILNPQAKVVAGFQPIMPTFQGLVSEEQLLQLIAYVRVARRSRASRRRRQPARRRRRPGKD